MTVYLLDANVFMQAKNLHYGFDFVSQSTKNIKIPNACQGVGVSSVNPYEMLRSEHAQFILGPNI